LTVCSNPCRNQKQEAQKLSKLFVLSLLPRQSTIKNAPEGAFFMVLWRPVVVPFTNRLFPASTFDLRTLLKVHAKGFDTRLRNGDQLVRRDQAFRLTAQLMLFQHSCHWFCRSRTVASARLMARHKTAYDQVLAAVSPETRRDYLDLVQA
jgi:hypothetical protein